MAPLLLLLPPLVVQAQTTPTTRYVSLDGAGGAYTSIQAAITAANAGDTIIVAAGTYHESLSWQYTDLTIQGAGAGQSIIDPSGASGPGGRCVFTYELSNASKIQGFTFQGGQAPAGYPGGGMWNDTSNLTVTDCTFTGNSAVGGGSGGGMENSNCSPTIANCLFTGNSAPDAGGYGGGMENYASNATVTGCIFSENTATAGGGVNNWLGNPTITDCTFTGNTAGGGGGLLNLGGSSATIANCTFSGNSALDGGGLANSNDTSPTIADCTFSGNTATDSAGDYSGGFGGGIDTFSSNAILVNCTFSGNSASYYGGAVSYYTAASLPLTVTNCILWGNTASIDGAGMWSDPSSSVSPIVSHTDSQDYASADTSGNFGADPKFVRAPFTNGASDFGDLRLKTGSPCIDAGDNTIVSSPPFLTDPTNTFIIDLAGNQRIQNGTVDLGAFEYFPGSVIDTTAPTVTWGNPSPAPNAAGWNHTAVDLSFTTTDDLSGVAPNSPVGPLHFTNEGANQTQNVTVTDNDGNSKTYTSPAIKIDMTAPTTSGSVTMGNTVTLSASDSLSGVKATYYTINGGARQTYTGPFILTGSVNTVQYWSVDNADNAEGAHSLSRLGVTLTVASVSGKKGGKVNLSATLKQTSNNAKLSGKTLLFTVNGASAGSGAITNKQGVASLSYTIPTTLTAGGHYTISATFAGDSTYLSGTGTGTLTVTR